MNALEKRVSQSFRSVEGWADSHQDLIPPEAVGQVEALRAANERLAQCVIDQELQDRLRVGGTVTLKQLRQELRQNHLVPIAAMARNVVAVTPELAVALRVPRPTADDAKLLASASAIANIGDAHKEVLVQHGLAANVVEELRAKVAGLQAVIDERRQATSRRVGATKAIKTELKTGRLVVQSLDIALTRVIRAQPALLAEWRNTKRVTVKPVHQASAPDATATSSEQKAA
jgi:hypothetical protein